MGPGPARPEAVVRAQQRAPLALELRLRPAGARGAGGGARLRYDLGVELRDVREGGGLVRGRVRVGVGVGAGIGVRVRVRVRMS